MSRINQRRQASDLGLRVSFGLRASGFGFRPLLCGLIIALASHPDSLWACAACAGQSDSAMAKGMNWGIMSLLAVIGVVLGGVTSFFVYLSKRSAAVAAASGAANPDLRGLPERLGLTRTLTPSSNPQPFLKTTDPIL